MEKADISRQKKLMFPHVLFSDIIWLNSGAIDHIPSPEDIGINELKLWLFIHISNKWMAALYSKWTGNIIRKACMSRKFRISENEQEPWYALVSIKASEG